MQQNVKGSAKNQNVPSISTGREQSFIKVMQKHTSRKSIPRTSKALPHADFDILSPLWFEVLNEKNVQIMCDSPHLGLQYVSCASCASCARVLFPEMSFTLKFRTWRFIIKLFETYNGTQSLYFLLEPALGGCEWISPQMVGNHKLAFITSHARPFGQGCVVAQE